MGRVPDLSTGAAFITVTPDGENEITVAPGANRGLTPQDVDSASETIQKSDVLVAQMEIPPEVVERAIEAAAYAVRAGAAAATREGARGSLPIPEVL